MYHTKVPGENGWYWVRFDDDSDLMCYWNPEDDEPTLLYPGLKTRKLLPRSVAEVSAWVGPIQSPFGEFEYDYAHFSEARYIESRNELLDLVMTVVDSTQTDKRLGTVTSVGLMEHGDAMTKTAAVFSREA